MSNFKKVLASTAALAGLISLAAPANATITQPTITNYVSGTAAPAATVAFATAGAPGNLAVSNVDLAASTAYSSAFTAGNTFTFTLSQGTYAVLPTIGTTGGSVAYVSGGAGQSFVTYQISGASTALSLSNVAVNSVTGVSNSSVINVVVSDGAGALAPVAAASKTFNVAAFADPYTISFAAAGTAPQVDLSATSPGSRYTNTNSADLGTITVTYAANVLRNWTNAANVAGSAPTSTFAVTLPAGPFNSVDFSGNCLGATTNVTAITGGVVTLTAAALTGLPATAAGTCTLNTKVNGPTTGTLLLGAGTTSAALTVALSNVSGTGLTGTTRSFSQTVTPISYANGSVFNAGYTVGADAAYDFFVNVSNGATAGPVIVSASTAGVTGTAVLATTLAANTSAIYSIATIKAALVLAGLPSTIFSSGGDRGALQVVVPTSARVTPLLLNKTNGQVVEVSRQ